MLSGEKKNSRSKTSLTVETSTVQNIRCPRIRDLSDTKALRLLSQKIRTFFLRALFSFFFRVRSKSSSLRTVFIQFVLASLQMCFGGAKIQTPLGNEMPSVGKSRLGGRFGKKLAECGLITFGVRMVGEAL